MCEPKNRHLRKSAYRVYQRALRRGELIRPDSCSICGSSENPIEGHHTDYAKPLSVIWVCFKCHALFHPDLAVFKNPQPKKGRKRIHEDDKARKREWARKHRAKKQSEM